MAKPLHETLINQAETTFKRSDIHTTIALIDEALGEYRRAGSPKIDAAVYTKFLDTVKGIVTTGLGVLDTNLPSVGGEQTINDLNTFVTFYREKGLRYLSLPAADITAIEDKIVEIRSKAEKARREGSYSKPEDFKEVSDIKTITASLSKDLADAIAGGTNWDPREPRTAVDMPILKLGRAIKDLEGLLDKLGGNVQEKQLKEDLSNSVLKDAQNLVSELQRRVVGMDQPAIAAFTARADSMPVSAAIQDRITEDVNAINDETALNSGVTELQASKSAVDGYLSSLAPRYPNEVLTELESLFPGKNIAAMEDAYKKYWNDKKGIIDEQISRRNDRLKALAEVKNRGLEVEEFKKRIREMIASVENSSPKAMESIHDVLEEDSREIYGELEKLRARLSDQEFRDIEQEVLFFDYRNTKRVLDQTITSHEWREVDYKDFYGNPKDRLINNKIYTRFDRIINQLSSTAYPGVDAAFLGHMNDDRDTFKAECEMRMQIFATEQSLDSAIWWNGDASERAQRGIPSGASAYWDIDQKTIATFLKPSREPSSHDKLRFKEEHRLNKPLGDVPTEVVSFDNPTHVEILDVPTTLNGEIMRLLDKLYADKIDYQNPDGTLKYPKFQGFFRTMHLKYNSGAIPAVIRELAENELGITPASLGMDENQFNEQIKRVWYLHTLFLNHSMLLSSSPNLSDTAYYANQFLDYALNETTQGVNAYDLLTLLLVVGKYDHALYDEHDNPNGKKYIFDIVGRVNKAALPKPKDWLEKMASAATPVSDLSSTSLRVKMLNALEHEHALAHGGGAGGGHHGTPHDYLASLPMVVVDKSAQGKYPFIPLPLQYMIFEDPSATYTLNRPPGPDGKVKEKRVKRWDASSPGSGAPITAADYTSTRGEILYEAIPWENVLSDSSLLSWYNNGNNALNLLALFRNRTESKILNREDIAALKKDAKYGATTIPRIGMEALTGRIDGTKLFDRFITVYALGKSIYLLEHNQNISKVETMLNDLIPSISFESVEAIKALLKAGFGTREALEEYGAMFRDQIKAAAKFQG